MKHMTSLYLMRGGIVSNRKPIALVALFLIIALIAIPLISMVSYNSLSTNQTEQVSQSSKISKHYFTLEETNLINSKIEGVDFVNG